MNQYHSTYDTMATSISYLRANANKARVIDQAAILVGFSTNYLQHLFTQWAGISASQYRQLLTVSKAKNLLKEQISTQEVADTLGLSSVSRLHEQCVHIEAVTPGQLQRQGTGLLIQHTTFYSPLGWIFLAQTPLGICRLALLDHQDARAVEIEALARLWPEAQIKESVDSEASFLETFENLATSAAQQPAKVLPKLLRLHVRGTNFQVQVWRALLSVKPGQLSTYSALARLINRPNAKRATGTAIGKNPVALLIPCHRVIRQDGQLGGYHWGIEKKQRLLAAELTAYVNQISY